MHESTCSSAYMSTRDGVVQRIVNPTYHSSVEYSQFGYMFKSQYILCLFQYDFFHVCNVRVVWLLTSQMLAL